MNLKQTSPLPDINGMLEYKTNLIRISPAEKEAHEKLSHHVHVFDTEYGKQEIRIRWSGQLEWTVLQCECGEQKMFYSLTYSLESIE